MQGIPVNILNKQISGREEGSIIGLMTNTAPNIIGTAKYFCRADRHWKIAQSLDRDAEDI